MEKKIASPSQRYPEGNLPCPGWMKPCPNQNAARQRQNTSFVEEERNWVTLCPACMAANAEHWERVWSELYSGCG
jgi:hypothetical protein